MPAKKYVKKPIILEGYQITRESRVDLADWPNWLREAWTKDIHEKCAISCEDWPNSDGTDRLIIHTPEGIMTVDWNDYIMQGIEKELYPVKEKYFDKTFEEIEI
jgi:hypothetical protein